MHFGQRRLRFRCRTSSAVGRRLVRSLVVLLALFGTVGTVLSTATEAGASPSCTGTTLVTCTFSFGGTGPNGPTDSFTVPAGVSQVTIDAKGAQGGDAVEPGVVLPGGLGAEVKASFPVTPLETLYLRVGGAGSFDFVGGGGGGGGSFVYRTTSPPGLPVAEANTGLLIAAAGGGGSGDATKPRPCPPEGRATAASSSDCPITTPGDGGQVLCLGANGNGCGRGGAGGGLLTNGDNDGLAENYPDGGGSLASNGSVGGNGTIGEGNSQGGSPCPDPAVSCDDPSGGGGGGFGGGGGAVGNEGGGGGGYNGGDGGGGPGSGGGSFFGASATDTSGTDGTNAGNGQVIVTFTNPSNSEFGSGGTGDGQFTGPTGVAVDPDGNVYVTDTGHDRVEKFASSGIYQSKFGSGGSSNGQFNAPVGVAADSNGDVYVVDRANRRVEKFDSSGNYVSQFGGMGTGGGQFGLPNGVAVDSAGDVYVVDTGNNRVEKFNSSGVYQSQFGTAGSGNGQFNTPFGVAVDSNGDVYVTDRGNNRVEKFDSSGTYLSQFGTVGSANGQFNTPNGVAVEPDGEVYVADTHNNRVEKFDSSGTYLSQFDSGGPDNDPLNGPFGVAVDSGGDVYVADTGNNRIVVDYAVPPSVTADQPSVGAPANTAANGTGTFSDSDDPVTITTSTGTISQSGSQSGTWSWSGPVTTTPYTVTVTATNADGATATTSFTVNPTLSALAITSPALLPAGTTGSAYSQGLTATGGNTPDTWSSTTTAGQTGLPPGITLSGSTLSGTPTTLGTYTFNIVVTDSSSPVENATQAETLIVTSTPAGLTGVSNTANSIKLSWIAVPNALRYNIFRSSTGMAGSYSYAFNTTGTSWTNTFSGTGNTTYFYEVSTVVGSTYDQTSAFTNPVSVTSRAVPLAPTGVTATAGSDAQINVSWNPVMGATSYTVSRATTSGGPYTVLSRQSGTTYANNGLAGGATYYYVVTATTSIGTSANSTEATATTLARPVAPVATATVASTKSVHVAWSAVTATGSTGPTTYDVSRATTSGGPYTLQAVLSTTSWPNNGLTHGTTYYYVVKAVVPGVGISPLSTEVSAGP